MTPSLSFRIVGFAVVAVALTAGIDFWIAQRALQLQRLQEIEGLLQRFASGNGFDGLLLKEEIEIIAPGTIVTFSDLSAKSAGQKAEDVVQGLVPQSLFACLTSEAKACVRGNLVAIRVPSSTSSTGAHQVAVASLVGPPWARSAFSILGTALAICILLSLILHMMFVACLTRPLGAIEQAANGFVLNGFTSFDVKLPPPENAMLPGPLKGLFDPGPECGTLLSSVVRMATNLREWRQKISDQEKQRLYWLSYLSHDLGAPLARVLARIQALQYDPDLSHEHRARLLESAHLEVTQLADVIGSISQFALLESDIECKFVEASLNKLLEHAVDVFEFEACQKAVELDLRIGSDIGKVRVERSLFRRAIENLISNAIRFTPEGGLVSVLAERSGDRVRISVSDTGIGISDEDLPTIFEFAFKGEKQVRPSSVGSFGLGLALVKRVAEIHHGEVTARNLEPQGAEFVISLPVAQ